MEKKCVQRLLVENTVFTPQWNRVETGLFAEKSTEITTLIPFSWWIFLGSTDHSAHPGSVPQHQAKRETLGCILPPSNSKPAHEPLNGTLCVSLLVLEWVWGHAETRLGPVLRTEGIAQYVPKRWIHWVSWAEQETLPWTTKSACLAPDFVLLSADLPCRQCCYCWEETLLSKHSHLGQPVTQCC